MKNRDEGPMDFNELSNKDSTELKERVRKENSILEKLEIIYSYVGFDEEGYLSKNYEGGDKRYFVPYGQEYIVCSFIEMKKCETVFSDENEKLEKKLKNISSSKEKKRLLNAHLEHIKREVKVAVPLFLYGFDKTELIDPIEYPESNFFEVIRDKTLSIHDGPFRGALLKGEGAACSKFKQHILQLLKELKESKIQGTDNIKAPKNSGLKVTFEDYLADSTKKIFPFLFENYRNATPKEVAFMIFALIKLEYFQEPGVLSNRTQLSNALSFSFNRTINRQSLSYHFERFQFLSGSEEIIVAQISGKIKKAFDSLR